MQSEHSKEMAATSSANKYRALYRWAFFKPVQS